MIHLRKNYGKFENRLNYTEIVVLESKKRKHSEFMNKLKLRMILWSTAEAVLRLYVWCHHDVLKRSYGLLRKRY